MKKLIKNLTGGYTPNITRFPGGSPTAGNLKNTIIQKLQNKKDLAEYDTAMAEYNKQYGSVGLNNVKHFIIHWSSCFVPGRERRGNFRRWLKRKLKYEG